MNYTLRFVFNINLIGKHPVSLLNEFCAKRKWDIPKFNTLDVSGLGHRKTFIMTVSLTFKVFYKNISLIMFSLI